MTRSGLNYKPVIIFIGESNSGGVAHNTSATSDELLPHSEVQILNPLTLSFEDLDIGTNNLLDHAGLESYSSNSHGWELELCNQVRNGEWPSDVVYLIKAGQGGSVVSEWTVNGTYFSKLVERVDVARQYFADNGIIPVFYVWFSLGINDAIANTDPVVFKNDTLTFLANIRKTIGVFAPFAMTVIMSNYSSINGSLVDIALDDKFTTLIPTSDAGLVDPNHWSYSGMKLIATRMKNYCLYDVGYSSQYLMSQNYAISIKGTDIDNSQNNQYIPQSINYNNYTTG